MQQNLSFSTFSCTCKALDGYSAKLPLPIAYNNNNNTVLSIAGAEEKNGKQRELNLKKEEEQ